MTFYFAALNDTPSDSIITLEMPVMKIDNDEIPKVKDNEPIPLEMLDFARTKGHAYLSELLNRLEVRKTALPKDFYECMRVEVKKSLLRLESTYAYVIHNISKMKSRQTLVEHRLEQWMIYSIKMRNKGIYDYCCYLKDCIENVAHGRTNPRIRMSSSSNGGLSILWPTCGASISSLVLPRLRSTTIRNPRTASSPCRSSS